MRIPLLVLGALVAIVLIVVGVTMTVDAAGSLSDVRIEDTRTAIPGSKDVELEEGKYVVFYEVSDDAGYVGGDGGVYMPPVEMRLTAVGGAQPLELRPYSTDFNISGGGRKGHAFVTVDVPRDGRYALRAEPPGPEGAAEAASNGVVLGKPITHRALRLIVGITGILAGLAVLALICALSIGLAVRKRRQFLGTGD